MCVFVATQLVFGSGHKVLNAAEPPDVETLSLRESFAAVERFSMPMAIRCRTARSGSSCGGG
jgi:hypothetical protein